MSVIAISRGSMSAAVKLAEGLRAELGGKIVTREEVVTVAERYGLQETGLSEKDIMAQHPPGFWERYSDARRHYLTCFKAALLDFVLQEESVVYHGNLAHILLNDVPFVLRVRVNAPLEDRVKVLMDAEGIAEDAATKKVKAIDQQRKRWTEFLYDADYGDPILFDLVLNMEKMTMRDAIDMVASEAKKSQFQPNEKTWKMVKDHHLATIAQVYLMHSPGTYGLDLKIKANSITGEVIIRKNLMLQAGESLDDDIRAALSNVKAIRAVKIESPED